tara:strand:+ start:849 stop:1949 length:1101 start_codon:yes stop_codon:yes gene_type:complete
LRLGGHTHTHTLDLEKKVKVDSGFIVMNDRNYPLLTRLLLDLKVEMYPTSMSFGVETEELKWCSDDFLKLRFLFNFNKIRLFFEMLRFNCLAYDVQTHGSIEEWLNENNFSNFFKENYVFPMSSSIWSSSKESIKNFPMRSLSSFFKNHGLFDLLKRPQWFSILGGSNTYIDKLIDCSNINSINIEASLHIERDQEKVIVKNNEVYKEYDAIIFACHANQIEEILKDMSSEEKEILFLFEYTRNNVLLHCDKDLMPKQKSLWSSWNSFKSEKYDYVSYWMNNLQKLDTKKDIFVTLGNYPEIDKERIFKSIYYEHPLYTEQTLEAQKLVKSIQGKNKTFYVGAHLGYGFHEDGIKSTVEILKIING